jgi:DNA-binding NarL/FixJ family response regulator
MCVVGRGHSLADAEPLCPALEPDLVVLEVEVGGDTTFELIAGIRSEQPRTKVVILTSVTSEIMIAEALRVGVRGFISKRESLAAVIQSLHEVAAGGECYSAEIKQKLRFDPIHQTYTTAATGRLQSLTPRQLEVLRHLARGDSVKEVARKMFLSSKSVDSHKYRIMQRLGVRDRVHLARFAIREGLVTP